MSNKNGSVCAHICEDGVRRWVCGFLWSGYVVSSECLACMSTWGVCAHVNAAHACRPWGRGCTNAPECGA